LEIAAGPCDEPLAGLRDEGAFRDGPSSGSSKNEHRDHG